MSTFGRIAVAVVAAGVLVAGTLVAAHYLKGPEAPPASPAAPTPTTVETPTGTSGLDAKHVAGRADVAVPAGAYAVSSTAASPAAPGAAGAQVAAGPGAAGGMAAAGPGDAAADEGLAMVRGQPVQAQKRLSEALRAGVDGAKGREVREALNALSAKIQLSSQIVPGDAYSKSYTVASGDALEPIGKRFLVPFELVMRVNGMTAHGVAAGQQIKVIQGPVSVEIFKARKELQAWLGDACIRVYPVAIGAENRTPEGTFLVDDKVKNPPYQPQHKTGSAFKASGAPDNPLGTRWIRFDKAKGLGIHGTIDPTSIGHDVSEGCIRLLPKDVEELYDMVVVKASKVTIRP